MDPRSNYLTATALGLWVLALGFSTACIYDSSGVPPSGSVPIDASGPGVPDASSEPAIVVTRKTLSIDGDQVPAALTDFPVLVRITDSELAANAHVDGLDIFFRDGAGNVLPFERESYDGATGSLVAWVKMDLTGADQDFYMYYGDGELTEKSTPAAVFRNGFDATWHLGQEPDGAGSMLDSTEHGRHATPINMEADDLVAGNIGLAIDFNNDGADEHISSPGAVTLPDWSISAWVKRDVTGADHDIFGFGVRSGCDPSSTFLAIRADRPRSHIGCAGDLSGATTLEAGSWYHLVLTQDDSYDQRFYVNGAPDGGPADIRNGNDLSTGNEVIGASWAGGSLVSHFDGVIDEVRVSSAVRSADWILTEYNNQRPDSSFIAVGEREELVLTPRRKKLSIAGAEVPSALTGFPVLVRIVDADLATRVHPTGLDIHFEDESGQALSFERVSYDGENGALIAWVKMDLTGADQDFYVYYGDRDLTEKSAPAMVWDADFAGVWHLEASATGPYRESSGAGYDSTAIAGIARTAGHVGHGVDVAPAAPSGIVVGDVAVAGDITISAWVDADTLTNWRNIVMKRNFGNDLTEYALDAKGAAQSDPGSARFYHNSDGSGAGWRVWETGQSVLGLGSGWQYLTVTHRAGEAAVFYVDGGAAITGVQTYGSDSPARVAQPTVDTVLGGALAVPGSWNWDGQLDEVRISATARSQDWITAEYNNQKPGSTFLTAGVEEEL